METAMRRLLDALCVVLLTAACAQGAGPPGPATTTSQPTTPSEEDLEHGRRQVRRMLEDRPGMRQFMVERGPVWQWVVRRFAGEGTTTRIDWDPAMPGGRYNSCRGLPWQGQNGFIRVRRTYAADPDKDKPINFNDGWGYAIYELFRFAYAPEYMDVYEDGMAGKLTREAYVAGNTRADHKALTDTFEFYDTVWLPWTEREQVETQRFRVLGGYRQDHDDWIKRWDTDRPDHPEHTWHVHYTRVVGPHLARTGKLVLTEADLSHGRQQLRAMLKDRRVMAKHLEEGDVLWEWAVRRFAGEGVGTRVNWRNKAPAGWYDSNRDIPYARKHGRIRVWYMHLSGPKKGRRMTFEDAWGNAVYQLLRIAYTPEYTRSYWDGTAGKFTREEYIAANTKIDHKALTDTKGFYETVWLPWAKQKRLDVEGFCVLDRYLPSHDDWVGQFDRRRPGHPGHVWNRSYNRSIAPYLIRTGKLVPSSAPSVDLVPSEKDALALTDRDMVYGEEQVEQMLKDRPVMAKGMNKDDRIWRWAARRFAGEGIGPRVRWRPARPPDGLNASRSIPFEDDKLAVQLSVTYATGPNKGRRMAFEDAWGYVIHQLFALGLIAEHTQIYEDAVFGKLTKEAYVEKSMRLEHRALAETKKFYETVWKPWAEQKQIPSRPFMALAGYAPSYEAWVKQSNRDERHACAEQWASHYDSIATSHSRNTQMPSLTIWERVSVYGLTGGGVLLFFLFVGAELRARRSARSRAGVRSGTV